MCLGGRIVVDQALLSLPPSPSVSFNTTPSPFSKATPSPSPPLPSHSPFPPFPPPPSFHCPQISFCGPLPHSQSPLTLFAVVTCQPAWPLLCQAQHCTLLGHLRLHQNSVHVSWIASPFTHPGLKPGRNGISKHCQCYGGLPCCTKEAAWQFALLCIHTQFCGLAPPLPCQDKM